MTLQGCGDSIQYLKNQMRELADSAESTVLVGIAVGYIVLHCTVAWLCGCILHVTDV